MWPWPEQGWRVLTFIMAPLVSLLHVGMGYGLGPAREEDSMWQAFRIPISGSELCPLPCSPKALKLRHREV